MTEIKEERVRSQRIITGQRVTLRWSRSRRGTVVRAGRDQSEVKWDDNLKDAVHITEHLVPLVKRENS